MKRVRFGIRGIPVFPNAATFVLRKVEPELAGEIKDSVETLAYLIRHVDKRLASRLFCEVE